MSSVVVVSKRKTRCHNEHVICMWSHSHWMIGSWIVTKLPQLQAKQGQRLLFSGHSSSRKRKQTGCLLSHLPSIILLFGAIRTSSSMASTNKNDIKKRLVYGKDDALFGCIEEQQGEKPFGNVLDAGTGLHSLRWIATLPEKGMTKFTAITADKAMQRNVQEEASALEISHLGNVVIGNWFDNTDKSSNNSNEYESLSSIEQQFVRKHGKGENDFSVELFDTILADYLIGAMDGFSPYSQDLILPKLCRLLRPGGRLYIVGLQPIPDSAPGPANIMCKVRKIRDACILLAGHRCYREYPVDWIQRQLEGVSIQDQWKEENDDACPKENRNDDDDNEYGFQLIQTSRFPILYRHQTIVTQINVARSKLSLFPTPELATEMKTVLDDLEAQSLEATSSSPTGRIKLGFDYVVSAEKIIKRKEPNNNTIER